MSFLSRCQLPRRFSPLLGCLALLFVWGAQALLQPGAIECFASLDRVSVAEPSCYARGIHGQPGVCGAYSLSAQERGSIVSISAGCGMTARTYELGLLRLRVTAESLLLQRGDDTVRLDRNLADAALLGDALEVSCPSSGLGSDDSVTFRLEGSDRRPASSVAAAAAAAANATSLTATRTCGSSLCCVGTPEWGGDPLFLLPSLRPHASSAVAAHLSAAGHLDDDLLPPTAAAATPASTPALAPASVTLTFALVLAVSSPFHRVRFFPSDAAALSRCSVRAVPPAAQMQFPPARLLAATPPRAAARRRAAAAATATATATSAGAAALKLALLPEFTACPVASAPAPALAPVVTPSGPLFEPQRPQRRAPWVLPERTLVYAVPSAAALRRGARGDRRRARSAAPVSASGTRILYRTATGLSLGGDQATGASVDAGAPAGAGAGRESHVRAGGRGGAGGGYDGRDISGSGGDEDDDDEAYQAPPVPGAVTFLQLRTFHKFVGMAVNAVMKPMVETVQDQTGASAGQSMQAKVKADILMKVPPQVIWLVKDPLRRNITNMVTDGTTYALTKTLMQSIPTVLSPHISVSMYEMVIDKVTTALAPLLERTITYTVSVAVPATLRRSLPLSLQYALNHAISHAVVPAVAGSLSHSTTATEHCRSCYYERKGCWMCGNSEESMYFRNYHSTHFADYYSEYYSQYYYAALNKVVNADVPIVIPASAGSRDVDGTFRATQPEPIMSVPDPPK